MKKIAYLLLIVLLTVSCKDKNATSEFSESIRLNQLGYYPTSVKQFILADVEGTKFKVLNEAADEVFSGKLVDNGVWKASGEKVKVGDFSEFQKEGNYTIMVDENLKSYPFSIKNNLYAEALNAAIKSYYYQRLSIPLEENFAGRYARKTGILDEKCFYHTSSGYSEGTMRSSGGWLDAGDYGKYVVNGSLTVGQMLLLAEQFPQAIEDGSLNIPESGNGVSDLLDELKYELDWILSMQDKDGGVFFKLTAKNFGGFIMPEEYNKDRFIIGKGTASSLSFAAVMAQASRIFKDINPEWSTKALIASENAWKWAVINNNIAFKNPEDVKTGEYGDDFFEDDFYWAAAELFISTKNEDYLKHLEGSNEKVKLQLTNSWKFFVRNNAFHSLLENGEGVSEALLETLKKDQILLADEILEAIDKNPYNIGLDRFEWGSNSDIFNQAMILCVTHRLTNDIKYLNGAEQITDYIFGKNATGYSFLTGFGSKRVMNLHHRPSGADGIVEPIPGFVTGGPNVAQQDKNSVNYTSKFPAKSFEDVQESYASNEVCLNWNAPAVYVLGYLQQHKNE